MQNSFVFFLPWINCSFHRQVQYIKSLLERILFSTISLTPWKDLCGKSSKYIGNFSLYFRFHDKISNKVPLNFINFVHSSAAIPLCRFFFSYFSTFFSSWKYRYFLRFLLSSAVFLYSLSSNSSLTREIFWFLVIHWKRNKRKYYTLIRLQLDNKLR